MPQVPTPVINKPVVNGWKSGKQSKHVSAARDIVQPFPVGDRPNPDTAPTAASPRQPISDRQRLAGRCLVALLPCCLRHSSGFAPAAAARPKAALRLGLLLAVQPLPPTSADILLP
jgi:hypothetical protein